MKAQLEVERAFLGGVLQHPVTTREKAWDGNEYIHPGRLPLLGEVRLDDFTHEAHALIYTAMCAMRTESMAIDALSLAARLDATSCGLRTAGEIVGNLSGGSCVAAVTGLDTGLGLPAYSEVAGWAQTLRDLSIRRRAVEAASRIGAKLSAQGTAKGAAGVAAELQLLAEEAAGRAEKPRSAMTEVAELAAHIKACDEAGHSAFRGFLTGIEALDAGIVGLERKCLSLWLAGPGDGKTALALQVARKLADEGWRVLFFSLEMSRESLARRMASAELGIPQSALATGALSRGQIEALERFATTLPKALEIDATTQDVRQIVARVRAAAAQGMPYDVVIIDYLQRIDVGAGDSWVTNGIASRALVDLAKETDAHVFCCGQLNQDHKKGKGSDPQPPTAGQTRGGGAEQDADLVVMLWNKWRLTKDPNATAEEREKTLARVTKNRIEQVIDIDLAFNGARQEFRGAPKPDDVSSEQMEFGGGPW